MNSTVEQQAGQRESHLLAKFIQVGFFFGGLFASSAFWSGLLLLPFTVSMPSYFSFPYILAFSLLAISVVLTAASIYTRNHYKGRYWNHSSLTNFLVGGVFGPVVAILIWSLFLSFHPPPTLVAPISGIPT